MFMWVFVFMLFSATAYSQGQEVNTLFGGIITDKGRASWALQLEYKQLELLKYEDFVFDGKGGLGSGRFIVALLPFVMSKH